MYTSQTLSLDNAPPMVGMSPFPECPNDRAELFDFVARLQTTLERQQLLDIFVLHLQSIVALRGLRFEYACDSLCPELPDYRFGALHGVSSTSSVRAAQHHLGVVTLFTREPLDAHERQWLDRWLGCLAHPLLNALRFDAAQRLAHCDPLTGVGNRAAYERAIERDIARASRRDQSLSLLAVDLDAFKLINDTHGHSVGDECLRRLVIALQQGIRDGGEVFRLGGDEFVIILPDADRQAAQEIARRLERLVASDGQSPEMSASIGCATWRPGMSPEELFESADQSLYAVKRAAWLPAPGSG